MQRRQWLGTARCVGIIAAALIVSAAGCATANHSVRYTLAGGEIREALSTLPTDTERGRKVLVSREANCILCHAAPETGERFFGNLAPPLSGAGKRLTPAQMRARIVDPLFFNPASIMPAYYRVDGLHRVAENLRGKPVLSAAQIEDVIAYLQTLQ